MPKMKSHSASKKRFKRTATGLVRRSRAYHRHHAWSKAAGQRRKLRKGAVMSDCDSARIECLLPYS